MGIEYNKNILQTVEEVRRRITDRVQSMTGLRIKELNATITDITFPEKEVRRRIGPRSETTEHDTSADETAIAPASPATPDSEPGASERDTMRVETRSQPERDHPRDRRRCGGSSRRVRRAAFWRRENRGTVDGRDVWGGPDARRERNIRAAGNEGRGQEKAPRGGASEEAHRRQLGTSQLVGSKRIYWRASRMDQTTYSPRITRLSWGRLETESGVFKDVRLYPGGVEEWDWNETGTSHDPGIQPADVERLLERGSTVVILSRGFHERLGVAPETLKMLEEREIPAHIVQTEDAARLYEELRQSEKVGALIHSTC